MAAQASGGREVEALLRSMTLEEKVGQLFVVTITPGSAGWFKKAALAGRLGGAILQGGDFDAGTFRETSAKMQGWAASAPRRIPILFTVDHEGGPVFTENRLGTTIFPGNMALGATGDAKLAEEAAYATGEELRTLGIHVDFSPVVDVNSNPKNPIIGLRSFGEDASEVARFGTAALKGFRAAGVAPTVKHFPGHGDADTDSHWGVPIIRHSLKQLEEVDLVPFKAAVAADVPIVMSSHILLPAVDPDHIVTLSSAALEGLLRGKLGFQGVIASDSLSMGAVSFHMRISEGAVRALEAGCDLLLLGRFGSLSVSEERVAEAVRSGRISRERLDRSVRRILKLKARLGLLGRPGEGNDPPAQDPKRLPARELARQIAERSVTMLKNDRALLPLNLGEKQSLLVILPRDRAHAKELDGFVSAIRSRHPNTKVCYVPSLFPEISMGIAVEMARRADVVVLGTSHFGTTNYEKAAGLYRRLAELGKPVVVASLMNPYDLGAFKSAPALIATYGTTPASMQAAVRLMFGEIPPQGRLPVTIPGAFPRGSGIVAPPGRLVSVIAGEATPAASPALDGIHKDSAWAQLQELDRVLAGAAAPAKPRAWLLKAHASMRAPRPACDERRKAELEKALPAMLSRYGRDRVMAALEAVGGPDDADAACLRAIARDLAPARNGE